MKKDKLFMIISISLLVICIIGSTYALYRGILSKNLGVNTTTHGLDYYINYVKGSDITSATLNPSTDYTGGSSSDIEFWKKDNTYDIYGKIELTINTIGTNLSNSPALKYSVVNNNEVLSSGSLQGTTAGSKLTILENLYLETTRQIYTVYIWLDNNEELGDISNESLSISVDCTASMIPTSAAQKIINLYTNASKSTVTNNNITYNTAPSVSLMNDRLGGTTENLDGGNIRYYGASPDNYIYFNCSDYSNQTSDTCELWRIIGVFDGKIKIMRNQSIGRYAWDSTAEGFTNDWTNAKLMKLLNPGFTTETNGGSLYFNSQSGTCYDGELEHTVSCDFTSTGLKNNVTKDMIEEHTWTLLGWNTTDIYSNQMYNYEMTNGSVCVGNQSNWIGKIALPYANDYGYASDLSKCNKTLLNYDDDTCTTNNWIAKNTWLLSISPNDPISSWIITSLGSVGGDGSGTGGRHGIRPTLYLNSNIGIGIGNGTSTNPYRIIP